MLGLFAIAPSTPLKGTTPSLWRLLLGSSNGTGIPHMAQKTALSVLAQAMTPSASMPMPPDKVSFRPMALVTHTSKQDPETIPSPLMLPQIQIMGNDNYTATKPMEEETILALGIGQAPGTTPINGKMTALGTTTETTITLIQTPTPEITAIPGAATTHTPTHTPRPARINQHLLDTTSQKEKITPLARITPLANTATPTTIHTQQSTKTPALIAMEKQLLYKTHSLALAMERTI